MLQITIPESEYYDSEKNLFVSVKEQTLNLEHSLLSVSKWEQKFNKPFISTERKTHEESKYYIRCMTLTQNVDPMVYEFIPSEVYRKIDEYIEAPMTATTISSNRPGPPNRTIITNEIIYYWMITLGIPFECQKWHLNRLLTLIKVCEIKSTPQKKMSRNEILSRNSSLNAARRAAMHTKG